MKDHSKEQAGERITLMESITAADDSLSKHEFSLSPIGGLKPSGQLRRQSSDLSKSCGTINPVKGIDEVHLHAGIWGGVGVLHEGAHPP